MAEPALQAGTDDESATKAYGVLRKRNEFLAVRRGAKARGAFVLVEANNRGDLLGPRVGLTVSKKNGNAVKRNRIKRRLREAVRLHAAGDMKPGNDYVIVSTPRVFDAPFAELCSDLSAAFAKANRNLESGRLNAARQGRKNG